MANYRSVVEALIELQEMRAEIDRLSEMRVENSAWAPSGLLKRKMDAWSKLRWDIMDEVDGGGELMQWSRL